MCDKAILENGGKLETVPDWIKAQEICDKAVDNYVYALEFVPDCYKTQKMCNKPANTYLSSIRIVSEYLWRREVVVITNAQLHSTKSKIRFYAGSNLPGDV